MLFATSYIKSTVVRTSRMLVQKNVQSQSRTGCGRRLMCALDVYRALYMLLFRGLFSPSLVLAVGGRRVGVVGYLTPETLGIRHHSSHL